MSFESRTFSYTQLYKWVPVYRQNSNYVNKHILPIYWTVVESFSYMFNCYVKIVHLLLFTTRPFINCATLSDVTMKFNQVQREGQYMIHLWWSANSLLGSGCIVIVIQHSYCYTALLDIVNPTGHMRFTGIFTSKSHIDLCYSGGIPLELTLTFGPRGHRLFNELRDPHYVTDICTLTNFQFRASAENISRDKSTVMNILTRFRGGGGRGVALHQSRLRCFSVVNLHNSLPTHAIMTSPYMTK